MSAPRMASWKLTESDRDRLRSTILEHRFAAIGAKLVARHAALAGKCYDKAFTKAERTQMEGLPAGWLAPSRTIKVQFAGKVTQLDFSGRPDYGAAPFAGNVDHVRRPVPYRAIHGVVLALDATDRLAMLHEALERDISRTREEVKSLSQQINTVMRQASTSTRLVALWPEVAPFLTGMSKTMDRTVPAVPIGALNKMLGLPVEGASA